ncbi:MAG: hypothetical protein GY852_02160, partial [bacterium]|nr:hypothetical protein [bacterium]
IWQSINSSTEENLNDVSYLVWGLSLCAVGENGTALISNDNGLTWTAIDLETSRDLTSISGNGAGVVCIVGKSALPDFLKIEGLFSE